MIKDALSKARLIQIEELLLTAGTSNGAPWEIPAWAKTDANGNFTVAGFFLAAAEGTHSLRVHIGEYFSPVLGLDILSCK